MFTEQRIFFQQIFSQLLKNPVHSKKNCKCAIIASLELQLSGTIISLSIYQKHP